MEFQKDDDSSSRQQCIVRFQKVISGHQISLNKILEDDLGEEKAMSSCLELLSSIEKFLNSWEALVDDAEESSSSIADDSTTPSNNQEAISYFSFPRNELLDAMSLIVANVGVGQPTIREFVLHMLVSSSSPACRQVILSMLPATLPSDNTNFEQSKASEEVLVGLRQVLEQDSAMIFSVLDCISTLCLDKIYPRVSFEMALQTVSTIPEKDFCSLLTFLLENVSNQDEAMDVIEAFRTEWRLMEEANGEDERSSSEAEAQDDGQPSQSDVMIASSEPTAAQVTIGTELNGEFSGNGQGTEKQAEAGGESGPSLMARALYTLLESTFEETEASLKLQNIYYQVIEQLKQDCESEMNQNEPVLICDLAVSIIFLQSEEYEQVVCRFLDTLMNQDGGTSIAHDLEYLMDIVNERPGVGFAASILRNDNVLKFMQSRMIPAIILFATNFLLLWPVRVRNNESSMKASATVSLLILKLSKVVSNENQAALLTSMLVVFRNLGFDKTNALSEDRMEKELVMSSVLDILVEMEKNKNSALELLETFLDWLKEEYSYGWSETIVRKISVLIACTCKDAVPANTASYKSKAMALLQFFLFPAVDKSVEQERFRASLCRGFIFADVLVSEDAISNCDLIVVRTWAERIVLPCGRDALDPRIASLGLKFMKTLREKLGKGEKDDGVFVLIQTILSNTGLVQMAQSYPEKRRRKHQLAYSKRLDFFLLDDKSRRFRAMVFSFASFLKNKDLLKNPIEWTDTAAWVFNLVDTYLAVGRHASKKWVPHGWLEASIELPKIDISGLKPKNKRQEAAVRWLSKQLCDFELKGDDEECRGDNAERDIRDMVQSLSDRLYIHSLIQSLLELGLGLKLSIAVSSAVLKNTYDHYRLTVEATQTNCGATRMMQHQLIKIYDMEQRCLSLRKIMKTLHPVPSRTKKPKSSHKNTAQLANEEIIQTIDPFCEKLKSIRTDGREFSPSSEILRICLLDTYQENLILEFLKSDSKKLNPVEVEFVVRLKQDILHHAISDLSGNRLFSDAQFSNSLGFVSELTCQLCKISGNELSAEEEEEVDPTFFEDITALCASYYQLLNKEMARNFSVCSSNGKRVRKVRYFLDVHANSIKPPSLSTTAPSHATAVETSDGLQTVSHIHKSMSALLQQLHLCKEGRIAFELTDTIATLGSFDGGFLLENAILVSWSALHTYYSSLNAPCLSRQTLAFNYSLERFSNTTNADVKTVLRCLSQTVKCPEKYNYLLHGLQRHWALLSLSPEAFTRKDNHLAMLTVILEKYLDKIYGIILTQIKDSKSEALDNDDEDDEEYRPPKSSRKSKDPLPLSKIPGLNEVSFSMVFDFLLQATVASLAVSSESLLTGGEKGPFFHLEILSEMFGSLVSMFRCKSEIFPRRSLSSLNSTSRSMLKICIYQLQRCIDWRNAQPMLSMEDHEAREFDPAALQFLKRLVDSFATHIIGEVALLCNPEKTSPNPSESSVDDTSCDISDSESKPLADAPEKLKTNNLSGLVKKTRTSLEKIASAHNLPKPKIDVASKKEMFSLSNDQLIVKSFDQLELIAPTSTKPVKRKRRIGLISSINETGESSTGAPGGEFGLGSTSDSSYIESSDESSSSSSSFSENSGSFGIDGNWNDDDSSNDGSFTLQSPLARKL